MPGVFITFEGGEGSGKTTIAALIKEALDKEGYQVTLTREPGGVEIAEKIRDIIHDCLLYTSKHCIFKKKKLILNFFRY